MHIESLVQNWIPLLAKNLGGGGGCSPKKTSRYTKIGKLALVFLVFSGFLKFPNWHWFFFVFFGFFGIGFNQNSKLETGFFWFLFLVFLFFFGLSFGQHSKLETGFWAFLVFFVFFGFFGIFWFFLAFDFRVRMPSQKNKKKTKNTKKTKKTQKKTVATPKLVNWLGFFWFFFGFFFGFFWGEHPPPQFPNLISDMICIPGNERYFRVYVAIICKDIQNARKIERWLRLFDLRYCIRYQSRRDQGRIMLVNGKGKG